MKFKFVSRSIRSLDKRRIFLIETPDKPETSIRAPLANFSPIATADSNWLDPALTFGQFLACTGIFKNPQNSTKKLTPFRSVALVIPEFYF
ncbi:MAG: hypothetical protein K8R21_06485 [Leptospira sp.]|nr:hypothetical protein [Leptospira sp.]